MKQKITEKQLKILKFIKEEVNKKGYPPSVREICTGVGLKSTSTVHGYLSRLEENGYIRRDHTKPRAIEVLLPGEEKQEVSLEDNVVSMEDYKKNVALVPIVGTVTAGEPILAHENIESSFPMPLDFVDDGNYFMLRIKGDSMIEIGIMDQDYVLVRQQQDAKNGDVIIALLDDSATCKTYYKEKDSIRLQPQNSSLSPIYSKNVQVIGLVKGVYRHM